jgi:SSS family solute:Na+ symporter
MALITAISDRVDSVGAILITVALIGAYVVVGGALSAGYVGIVKTCAICLSVGVCGLLVLARNGGWQGIFDDPALARGVYFNLFGRGVWVDGGSGLSLVLGVLSEQAYVQAMLSAKSLKVSRAGGLLAAFLMPAIGAMGVLVGLSMRHTHPGIASALALPTFILEYLPAPVAGMMLAALLITLVGSGAGLSLGIATVIANDILLPKQWKNKPVPKKEALRAVRGVLVGVLLVATLAATTDVGGLIMNWSFLSMGLRGAVVFAPLVAALFAPGRVDRRLALAAIIAGPVATLAGSLLLPADVSPVWAGVTASFVLVAVGFAVGRRGKRQPD